MAKKREVSAWAHLPNAALIDAVLADVKARQAAWTAAGDATWDAALEAAWDAAWTAARAAARDAARDAAWDAVRDALRGAAWGASRDVAWDAARAAAWDAARDAILALIAWDDCAHLLDLPSTTLRTMIDLCDTPACHQAALLLPYVLVKEGTPIDLT